MRISYERESISHHTSYWKPESFEDGNNQITAVNHSNADLSVSFDISDNMLDGHTKIQVVTNNFENFPVLAQNMLLEKVAQVGGEAKYATAYVT